VQFDANVPATNIPGSYATYTKVVDSAGNTVTFYKTTYAPDGSMVHVKVKYP
jgi:gamma-glutamyltranspeptidase